MLLKFTGSVIITLFDFDIKYCAGKSNQAADALSQHPENPNSASESSDEGRGMGDYFL